MLKVINHTLFNDTLLFLKDFDEQFPENKSIKKLNNKLRYLNYYADDHFKNRSMDVLLGLNPQTDDHDITSFGLTFVYRETEEVFQEAVLDWFEEANNWCIISPERGQHE